MIHEYQPEQRGQWHFKIAYGMYRINIQVQYGDGTGESKNAQQVHGIFPEVQV